MKKTVGEIIYNLSPWNYLSWDRLHPKIQGEYELLANSFLETMSNINDFDNQDDQTDDSSGVPSQCLENEK